MKRISVFPQKKPRIILVGNGMSGFKFCQKFIKYDLASKFDLLVFGEENFPAYDRVNLTNLINLDNPEELFLAKSDWYARNKIVLQTGEKVVEINRIEKWIKTDNGTQESFDKLILATGSVPFIPAIDGIENEGVFSYRTINDLLEINKYRLKVKNAVIIGGGILGLEAARALYKKGIQITIVERSSSIMPNQLDTTAAGVLQNDLEKLGLKFLLGKQVIKLTDANKIVTGVIFSDDSLLSTEMVIFAAGIKASDDLGKSSGIEIAPKGGIVTNEYHKTSDESIFAIGECAWINNKIWGLAAPSFEMAEVMASRLKGIYKVFTGDVPVAKLKILETRLASFGDALGESPGCLSYTTTDLCQGVYKRINVSPDGKYLLGAILVGDLSGFSFLLQMIRNKVKIHGDPMHLIQNDANNLVAGMLEWSENTRICICEEVSIGNLLSACRENKIITVDQLQYITGAGTGCESCVPVLEQFIEEFNESNSLLKN